jgi:hypothetical protein
MFTTDENVNIFKIESCDPWFYRRRHWWVCFPGTGKLKNEKKRNENKIQRNLESKKTKFNEICKVRKRNPTKRNDEICKVRKQIITKRNEIYKVRKQYQMKKKNEFCKVRQESKRNKRLFFVSTTRDIQ